MLDASMKKIAHILGSETRLDRPVDRISTDSRDVDGKTLYIPLKGERFDGHDFIAGALEKGAAGALSERPEDVMYTLIFGSVPEGRTQAHRLPSSS